MQPPKKKVSKYRVYKDLKLNPGNFNDFLKNNNLDKLSFKNCKKAYDYVVNY